MEAIGPPKMRWLSWLAPACFSWMPFSPLSSAPFPLNRRNHIDFAGLALPHPAGGGFAFFIMVVLVAMG
ncbi:MAG: hypothetical protein IPK53_03360 [bacterium]|nr:hypothetical protein [bacterium]